jgi:hypothetical protein
MPGLADAQHASVPLFLQRKEGREGGRERGRAGFLFNRSMKD